MKPVRRIIYDLVQRLAAGFFKVLLGILKTVEKKSSKVIDEGFYSAYYSYEIVSRDPVTYLSSANFSLGQDRLERAGQVWSL